MFNIYTLIKAIEKIGIAIPDVNTVVLGDIFELNSRPDIDYSVFAIVQDRHEQDDSFFYFNCFLYYVDRLTNDGENRLEIQSHGCSLLSTVISKIEELGLIVNTSFNTTYQPFNQRFSDECAGVYARVSVQIPIDCTTPFDIMVDPLLGDLAVYEGGTYYPADYGVDAFRVVSVSGQSFDYYSEHGKTAQIDNGFHTFEVTENGVYIDGSPVVSSMILSAYTYDKQTVNNIIQAALSGFDQVIAQVSANTENISINTGDILTLSAMTDDFVAKKPTIIRSTSGNPADYNDLVESGYYYVSVAEHEALNSPFEGWQSSCMVHTIRLWTPNEQDTVGNVVQYASTQLTGGNTWPRLYFRVRAWSDSGMTWSPWERLDDTGFVKKNPELHRGYDGGGYNFDFNDYTTTGYYVLESMSSGNTVNGPGVYGNAILSVIALTKTTLDDVVQTYYTARDNTGDTDIYLRRRYWKSDEDEHYWGQWIKVFSQGEIQSLQDQIDSLRERIEALENAD